MNKINKMRCKTIQELYNLFIENYNINNSIINDLSNLSNLSMFKLSLDNKDYKMSIHNIVNIANYIIGNKLDYLKKVELLKHPLYKNIDYDYIDYKSYIEDLKINIDIAYNILTCDNNINIDLTNFDFN